MNFNKLLALFCGICSLTIFVTYFINYYEALEQFSSSIQRVVIGISCIGALGFIGVLIWKAKELFTKNYIYTTIILTIIAVLAMWLNYFLYVRI